MKGEFDRYEPHDPDSVEKQCPWCGETLHVSEEVVTLDGRRAPVGALAPPGFDGWAGIRLYHERCLRKRELVRRRAQNTRLSEFC